MPKTKIIQEHTIPIKLFITKDKSLDSELREVQLKNR